MKYENLQMLSDKNFRRITGVKRTTFSVMVKILEEAHKLKKKKGGRSNKICFVIKKFLSKHHRIGARDGSRVIMNKCCVSRYCEGFWLQKGYGVPLYV